MISKPDRRSSGYRYIHPAAHRSDQVYQTSQELGFTLAEIKELLTLRVDNSTSSDVIRKQADSKCRDVQEKIDDLSQIKSTLAELIDSCKANKKTEDCVILRALEGENETGKKLR